MSGCSSWIFIYLETAVKSVFSCIWYKDFRINFRCWKMSSYTQCKSRLCTIFFTKLHLFCRVLVGNSQDSIKLVKHVIIQHLKWQLSILTIGTTRPIPPNRRSFLGCIRWKDMSNPKHLRWNVVLTETYGIRSVITNDRKQCAIGSTRPIPPNRRLCQVALYT